MRRVASAVIMSIAALSTGAAPPRHASPPAYVDAETLFPDEGEAGRWSRMKRVLAHDFDQICGDTYCEGEFSDIEPILFVCSAARGSGELKHCVWLFNERTPESISATGEIEIDHRSVVCDIPVASTAAVLADALLAPGKLSSLDRKLPGTDTSIGEALVPCL